MIVNLFRHSRNVFKKLNFSSSLRNMTTYLHVITLVFHRILDLKRAGFLSGPFFFALDLQRKGRSKKIPAEAGMIN